MRTNVPGIILLLLIAKTNLLPAQQKWVNVDTQFAPLPAGFHLYKTTDSLDGKPFIAYYAEARLKDKRLDFTTDTTFKRRITPSKYYEKNNSPLLVVNCTFFSFESNKNLNVVIKEGKLIGYNIHSIPMKGKDTFQYRHPIGSAIGINKKREADIAWIYTDSSNKIPLATQIPFMPIKDSSLSYNEDNAKLYASIFGHRYTPKLTYLKKWKMRTAIGGGPVLVQDGKMQITNEEELKFSGKAINDAHPRTGMGYTADGRLIIMVIQGRFSNAAGATLQQEAKLLADLGCIEALNLDGGGSSCMLINGKETIKPSSDGVQRPVPAVFMIKKK